MEMDQASLLSGALALDWTAAAGASTVGNILDTNDENGNRFESLTFFIASGTITTGTFAVVLEESDDQSVWTAVDEDERIGDLPTWLVTDDDTIRRVGVVGKKRYQRLTLTGASTPVGEFIAFAVFGNPKILPVAAQSVT